MRRSMEAYAGQPAIRICALSDQLRRTRLNNFGDRKMLGYGDALDAYLFFTVRCYFFSRKRRLLVNLFRNKRRRFDCCWKDTELACYLLETLLVVRPVE